MDLTPMEFLAQIEFFNLAGAAFQHLPWLAIVVAVVASFFLGMLWYSVLFGKLWMKCVGLTMEEAQKDGMKGMVPRMLLELVNNVVLVLAVYLMMVLTRVENLSHVATLVGVLWLGVGMPVSISNAIWEPKRSLGLLFINGGRYLVGLAMIACILLYV